MNSHTIEINIKEVTDEDEPIELKQIKISNKDKGNSTGVELIKKQCSI